jgi:hypothetical protein
MTDTRTAALKACRGWESYKRVALAALLRETLDIVIAQDLALATAREEGARKRESEIVAWLGHQGAFGDLAAELIASGKHRPRTP